MFKKPLVALGIVTIMALQGCDTKQTATVSEAAGVTADPVDTDAVNSAIEQIKKEKNVVRATLDNGVFYAEVQDDGNRRDAFAAELCEILRAKEIKASVKVVEHATKHLLESNSPYGIVLGESSCQ